jgi:RNA exonuclease 1
MGQKRPWKDYESDIANQQTIMSSIPGEEAHLDGSKAEADARANKRDAAAVADDEGWQVAGVSKKKKKKKDKKGNSQAASDGDVRRLRFNEERNGAPVRVKDLQTLVLYALTDGVAPTWVAVRDAKSIQKVLVLMVPGMDKAILQDAVSRIATVTDSDSPAESIRPLTAMELMLKRDNKVQTPVETLAEYIISIKAPGDSKTGRMHSPLQTMLISPEENTRMGKRDSADIFQPVRTPLVHFIH